MTDFFDSLPDNVFNLFQRGYVTQPMLERGMRLTDRHLVRIPHGTVQRREPSGRRTPLYDQRLIRRR